MKVQLKTGIHKRSLVLEEKVARRILLLRGEKVILSLHLAELYAVETRVLNQAVKRNRDRFPEDFAFQLSEKETEWLVSQNVIPHRKHFGGSLPYVFTEQGVAMLSSVLRSRRAVHVNIEIMRAFVKLRRILGAHKDLARKLDSLRKNTIRSSRPFSKLSASLWHRPILPKNVVLDLELTKVLERHLREK